MPFAFVMPPWVIALLTAAGISTATFPVFPLLGLCAALGYIAILHHSKRAQARQAQIQDIAARVYAVVENLGVLPPGVSGKLDAAVQEFQRAMARANLPWTQQAVADAKDLWVDLASAGKVVPPAIPPSSTKVVGVVGALLILAGVWLPGTAQAQETQLASIQPMAPSVMTRPIRDIVLDSGHIDFSGSVGSATLATTFLPHGLVGFTANSGAQLVMSVWPSANGYRLHFALQGFLGGGTVVTRNLNFAAAGAALLLEVGDNKVALGGAGPSLVCALSSLPGMQQCSWGIAVTGTWSGLLASF
jgi:hypothetical protein